MGARVCSMHIPPPPFYAATAKLHHFLPDAAGPFLGTSKVKLKNELHSNMEKNAAFCRVPPSCQVHNILPIFEQTVQQESKEFSSNIRQYRKCSFSVYLFQCETISRKQRLHSVPISHLFSQKNFGFGILVLVILAEYTKLQKAI